MRFGGVATAHPLAEDGQSLRSIEGFDYFLESVEVSRVRLIRDFTMVHIVAFGLAESRANCRANQLIFNDLFVLAFWFRQLPLTWFRRLASALCHERTSSVVRPGLTITGIAAHMPVIIPAVPELEFEFEPAMSSAPVPVAGAAPRAA
jgi:hypothetical protein